MLIEAAGPMSGALQLIIPTSRKQLQLTRASSGIKGGVPETNLREREERGTGARFDKKSKPPKTEKDTREARMAAPVKRPHLSFSVEAILSLSKKMRKANDDTKEEERKEIDAGAEESEESTPDSTSQTNLVKDDGCGDKVLVGEKEAEENVPDSTSPEKDAKKEENRLKPGVIAVGDVQVNFRFKKCSPRKKDPQCSVDSLDSPFTNLASSICKLMYVL